jgi:integrase
MLVWTYLVTGARRGEVLALRWEHLDLITGVLPIRHSVSEQRGGATTIKGTKTHQSRRISLDAQTLALLIDHRERVIARCTAIGAGFDDLRFIFSYAPDHTRPCSPSAVTHRYARMVAKLGVRTHLHAMRHYSATELLASGVDLRTVAGRLGHGSGGATTLKVYRRLGRARRPTGVGAARRSTARPAPPDRQLAHARSLTLRRHHGRKPIDESFRRSQLASHATGMPQAAGIPEIRGQRQAPGTNVTGTR